MRANRTAPIPVCWDWVLSLSSKGDSGLSFPQGAEASIQDDGPIWDVFLSANLYPSVIAAAEVGLFEALAKGPTSRAELCISLSLSPRSIDVLVDLMGALGFIRQSGSSLELTTTSRKYLVSESRFFWGGMFRFDRDRRITGADVLAALRRDSSAPANSIDGLWTNSFENSQQARLFTAAMHSHSLSAALRLPDLAPLRNAESLLDVGGGSGCYSVALVQRFRQLHSTLIELPDVAAIARDYVEASGVASRIALAPIDMFREPWPAGFDAVLFSNVLHDWNEEQCIRLLRSAHASLRSGGTLLVHELLLSDDRIGSVPAASFSVTMLRLTNGIQRSAAELFELFRTAGFRDPKVLGRTGYHSLCLALA